MPAIYRSSCSQLFFKVDVRSFPYRFNVEYTWYVYRDGLILFSLEASENLWFEQVLKETKEQVLKQTKQAKKKSYPKETFSYIKNHNETALYCRLGID